MCFSDPEISRKRSQFQERLLSNTFPDYTSASCRKKKDELFGSGEEYFNLYSVKNLFPVILSVVRLLFYLAAPYALILSLVLLTLHIIFFSHWEDILSPQIDSVGLKVVTSIFIALFSLPYFLPARSPTTGEKGSSIYGASFQPGLYYSRECARMKSIMSQCPFLSSPMSVEASLGSVSGASRTPWLLSGDIRTLVPFLLFSPPPVSYTRRWVRTPLADGPSDRMIDEDEDGSYEAVALDWAQLPPAEIAPSSSTLFSFFSSSTREELIEDDIVETEVVLLLLAGLTGGSSEGYILDMVNTAQSKGWMCLVMTGRGLSGSPCSSKALFHGARTTDLVASASAIRKSLSPSGKLFVVGISMGAIVAANAACKNQLDSIIDGVVCISGCFNTDENSRYEHSLRVWQPILSHPLKGAFVIPEGNLEKMKSRVGVNVAAVVTNTETITEFDHSFITPLHNFRSAQHYYEDMSAHEGKMKNLRLPLLAIHAADDPILHVDTVPAKAAWANSESSQNSFESDNKFVICLVTRTGGHVGWPIGLFPWLHRWTFQNTLTLEFCSAIASIKMEQKELETVIDCQ